MSVEGFVKIQYKISAVRIGIDVVDDVVAILTKNIDFLDRIKSLPSAIKELKFDFHGCPPLCMMCFWGRGSSVYIIL